MARLAEPIERYRAGWERAEVGYTQWVEGMLEMAEALAEARAQHESEKVFEIALIKKGVEFHTSADRAALIQMGQDPKFARILLEEARLRSPSAIWQDEANGGGTGDKDEGERVGGGKDPFARQADP